ncbi:hypothetical protein D3C87_2047850 [compost metagenome]
MVLYWSCERVVIITISLSPYFWRARLMGVSFSMRLTRNCALPDGVCQTRLHAAGVRWNPPGTATRSL